MNQILNINLQSLTVGAVEGYWLNIADADAPSDAVTLGEAADFIDELYSLDPCDPEDNEGGEDADREDSGGAFGAPVAESDYLLFAKDFLATSAVCAASGDYECTIRVARSHQAEPYKLVFDRGEETLRRTEAGEAYQAVQVDGASSAALDLPVAGTVQAQWDGLVFDRAGACAPPEITVLGSTLNFGKEVTGSLTVRYPTVYDLVDVAVFGIEGDPEPQECRVLAFYHGIVVEHVIEPPERDESTTAGDEERLCTAGADDNTPADTVSCYHNVTYKTLCRCSGDTADEYTKEVGTDCPPSVKHCPGSQSECRHLVGSRSEIEGYTTCPGEEDQVGSVSDPEYFLEQCCEYPPPDRSLPPCKTIRSAFGGGKGLDAEIKALYPGAVFVPVGPGLGICGEVTTTWQVSPLDCCDGVAALVWDPVNNPTTIAPSSSAVLYVLGGKSPYTWDLGGQLYALVGGHPYRFVETTTPYVRVYSTPEACGTLPVEVTDGCSSVRGDIRCTVGKWKVITNQVPKGDCLGTTFIERIQTIPHNANTYYLWGESPRYRVYLGTSASHIHCLSGSEYSCNCADWIGAAKALDEQPDCFGVDARCWSSSSCLGETGANCTQCWSVGCWHIDTKYAAWEWVCP